MTFHIKGCRIHINFYFFALLCVVALLHPHSMMVWGILFAALHELGHLTCMLLLPKQAPDEVNVTPFGIQIKRQPLSEWSSGNLTVLAAGSAVNLALAMMLWRILPRAAAMNLMLGVMNLLPVEGLDGGGILKYLLCLHGSEQTADVWLTCTSIASLTVMVLAGVWVLFRTKYNFTLLTMALWLLTTMLIRLMKK